MLCPDRRQKAGVEGAGAGPGGGTQPPASPAATEGGPAFGPQVAPIPAKTFDLANAYSIDGWYGDSYVDLLPDRLETAIVVGDARESFGAAHIATRLGLETTGITLPLARDARKITNAAAEPNPILVGRSNDLVRQLVKIGKARLDDLKAGEGAVQIVPRAFGAPTATVRNATKLDDDRYRIGCAITQIAEHHKRLLDGYAADQHTDRRRLHPGGLVSKIRSAA